MFTIIGNKSEIGGVTGTIHLQSVVQWSENGLPASHVSTGTFDASGNVVKTGGGSWEVDAPEGTPMRIEVGSLKTTFFAPVGNITIGTIFASRQSAPSTPLPPSTGLSVNVVEFGAVGNNISDDTVAIQSAIDALPEDGGVVDFPPGTYRLTGALTLRSGIHLRGAGPTATVLFQTNTAEDGLKGVDLRFITIEGLRISGPSSGTGKGINFTLANLGNVMNISMNNVFVRTFGSDGLYISNPIVSTFTAVHASENKRHGFNFVGESSIAGTSVSFNSCYANANEGSGFRMETMAYSGFFNCASEAHEVDYDLITSLGLTFTSCGSEKNAGKSWNIAGGYGTTIVGGWVYENSGIGVHISGGSVGNTVMGLNDTSPTATATAFIKVDDDGSRASIINVHNTSPFVWEPGAVNQMSDAATDAWIVGNLGVPGELTIGPDTNLYRVSPNVLATDDGLTVGNNIYSYGDIEALGAVNVGTLMQFSGSATTNLYKTVTNRLATDGGLDVGQGIYTYGDIETMGNLDVGEVLTLGGDANLYRVSENRLATDARLDVGQGLYTYGDIEAMGYMSVGAVLTMGGDANLYRAGDDTLATDSTFNFGKGINVGGDINFMGMMTMGEDVNLYRLGANSLATDDALTVGGRLYTYADVQSAGGLGVNGNQPVGKQTITGATTEAKVASIEAALRAVGIIV